MDEQAASSAEALRQQAELHLAMMNSMRTAQEENAAKTILDMKTQADFNRDLMLRLDAIANSGTQSEVPKTSLSVPTLSNQKTLTNLERRDLLGRRSSFYGVPVNNLDLEVPVPNSSISSLPSQPGGTIPLLLRGPKITVPVILDPSLPQIESPTPVPSHVDEDGYKKKSDWLESKKDSMRSMGITPYYNTSAHSLRSGPQITVLQEETLFDKDSYLNDLSAVSVVIFCEAYQSYRGGLNMPKPIQRVMNIKVKETLVSSIAGAEWNVMSISNFDTWSADDVLLFLKYYITPITKSDFYQKLKVCSEFPMMSKKYVISSENFHFFNDRYRKYVTKFRFAYLFLTECISDKSIELPYLAPGANSKCLKNLFLNRLPADIGKRILEEQDNEVVKKVRNIEDLMVYVDSLIEGAHRRHRETRKDNMWIMNESDYESKYGTSELAPRVRRSVSDKPTQSNIYPIDSSEDEYEELNQKDVYQHMEEELQVAEGYKPLFPNKGKPGTPTPYRHPLKPDGSTPKPQGGDRQVQPDIPRVCFGDFWGGKCTKQKCEFCGPNSIELGRKYWAYIVPLLVVHRYKPYGSMLTYTKGAALQKPAGVLPNRDPKANKLDRLDEEEENYPGDLDDGT
jgi:hypothetical protein